MCQKVESVQQKREKAGHAELSQIMLQTPSGKGLGGGGVWRRAPARFSKMTTRLRTPPQAGSTTLVTPREKPGRRETERLGAGVGWGSLGSIF